MAAGGIFTTFLAFFGSLAKLLACPRGRGPRQDRSAWVFLKTATLAGMVTAGVVAFAGSADAAIMGTLKVYNSTDSALGGQVTLMQKTDANDLFVSGSPDNDTNKYPPTLPIGSLDVYSRVLDSNSSVHQARNDSKLSDNDAPFDLYLVFNGTTPDIHNWLTFDFGSTSFGSKSITLQTPTGNRYDIRKIIDGTLGGTLNPNAGRFTLPDLATGTYSVSSPYANYHVDFNPVPEPTTLGLLTAGAGLLLARRRRQGYGNPSVPA